MIHRIAFAGASGTGKTTLATPLASALGLELQPSFARQVATEMGFASPYDVDAAGRRGEFQLRVLDCMLGWQLPRISIGFVSDRTVWDAHAYTAEHCEADVVAAHLQKIVRACHAANLRTSAIYTQVVFCPMDSFFVLGDDVARCKDASYHRRFEKLLLRLLEAEEAVGLRLNRSLLRVPAGKRSQWVNDFLSMAGSDASSSHP